MPITITTPPSGGPFGPGFRLAWSSDFIGPLELGTQLIVTLELVPPAELVIQQSVYPTQVPFGDVAFGRASNGQTVYVPVDARAPQGVDAQVRALLRAPGGATIDSTTTAVPVKVDYQSGQQVVEQLQGQTPAGGFTEEDRIVLQDMSVMTNAWLLWDLVGELVPPVLDLIGNVIRTRPLRELVGDVQDHWSFNIPAENPLWQWIGMEWQIQSFPDGIGVDEGNPQLTEIDYMQLELVRLFEDGTGSSYEGLYSRKLTQTLFWGTNNPDRVQGYVMPGCVVRIWLLQQRAPLAAADQVEEPPPDP